LLSRHGHTSQRLTIKIDSQHFISSILRHRKRRQHKRGWEVMVGSGGKKRAIFLSSSVQLQCRLGPGLPPTHAESTSMDWGFDPRRMSSDFSCKVQIPYFRSTWSRKNRKKSTTRRSRFHMLP